MKTEVKFRELPEKVQWFIIRMFGSHCDSSDHIVELVWLHNLGYWRDATDYERLAYAEWRYPVGTVCKRIDSECTFTICDPNGSPMFFGRLNVEQIKDEEWYNQSGKYLSSNPPIYKDGKWAEIISEPDIKEASPEAQQEFVKANPGMQHVEEPKAGDMVEVSDDGKNWGNAYNWFLIGRSINRDCYYCESDGQTQAYWKFIRLPQKSEVESKVKELMGDMLPIKFVGYENTYVSWDEAKEKIIEAIKWGQANPDKI